MATVPRNAGASAAPRKGPEEMKPFQASPETLSRYLETMKPEEIEAQLKSVEGRRDLYAKLMENGEKMKDIKDFNPADLERQLELAGDTLNAKERFMEDARSPEKEGMFRRAWEKVKGFPRKHPVVTALLALAVAAGGVAAGFYLTGNWELLLSKVGLNKIMQAVGAQGELIPPTPLTPPFPGGGVFEIPGGTAPPDLNIPI